MLKPRYLKMWTLFWRAPTSHSRDLIARMADRVRDSIRTANEAGIDDPIFVTLGEEVRAWKFILNPRFDGIRDRLNETIRAWFEGGPET